MWCICKYIILYIRAQDNLQANALKIFNKKHIFWNVWILFTSPAP